MGRGWRVGGCTLRCRAASLDGRCSATADLFLFASVYLVLGAGLVFAGLSAGSGIGSGPGSGSLRFGGGGGGLYGSLGLRSGFGISPGRGVGGRFGLPMRFGGFVGDRPGDGLGLGLGLGVGVGGPSGCFGVGFSGRIAGGTESGVRGGIDGGTGCGKDGGMTGRSGTRGDGNVEGVGKPKPSGMGPGMIITSARRLGVAELTTDATRRPRARAAPANAHEAVGAGSERCAWMSRINESNLMPSESDVRRGSQSQPRWSWPANLLEREP